MGILGGSKRDRLMAAAAALCTRHAYDEVTEEAIAARGALPAATMWRLFPAGKEECLEQTGHAILHAVVKAVSESYSPDRSEWESVIVTSKAILELMAANPDLAYLSYVFARQLAPERLHGIYVAGHRVLEAMLERGWEYSGSADQPAATAPGALGASQALVRRELAAGRAWRLPLLLPDSVYSATVPFLGQREALRLARQAEGLLEAADSD